MSPLRAEAVKIREQGVFVPVRRTGPRTIEIDLDDTGDPLVTGLTIDQSRNCLVGEARLTSGETVELEIGMLCPKAVYLVPTKFVSGLHGINFSFDGALNIAFVWIRDS